MKKVGFIYQKFYFDISTFFLAYFKIIVITVHREIVFFYRKNTFLFSFKEISFVRKNGSMDTQSIWIENSVTNNENAFVFKNIFIHQYNIAGGRSEPMGSRKIHMEI